MRNPFLACAAVVLTAAALAACGSSADGNDPEAAGAQRPAASGPAVPGSTAGTPTASTPPAADAAEGDGGDGAKPGAQGPTARAEGPKTPSDAITPATGTFTKQQKKYLEDRVPEGMDPAAVLQTGQETCDRLRYLVKADRDTAVGAVATEEIPDAAAAVAGLCPQHQDLVDEAAYAYPDGTHTGKALRPGDYRSVSPTPNCSWEITGAGGKQVSADTSTTGKSRTITIPKSARTFTSTGCYAWLPEGDRG
ncbi:hypothetical protein ACF07U_27445 [Streptomyces californicus]|uniref:hypothetical protein n=1 Tax=Streptomyces TaxID=1883 RepID=UPI0015C4652D|nr:MULTISPECIES: hypothetical protein [Streptomyces]MCF3167596.1 hypothetical protein [Streptomyces violaceoruber]MDW4900798.1 hypothetical protein [Streptomyces californicus]QLG31407.1 hypothetical protein HXS80_06675 [Streptomyces sp. CB04723]